MSMASTSLKTSLPIFYVFLILVTGQVNAGKSKDKYFFPSFFPKSASGLTEPKKVEPEINKTETTPLLHQALSDYRLRHADFMQSDTLKGTERVIIYSAGPNDGYGNRLPGVVTAFLWALLDDRILLVEWRDDPVLMPEAAPFQTLFSPLGGSLQMDVDLLTPPLPGRDKALALNGRFIWEAMSVSNLTEAFPNRVIKFNSDDWLVPLLAFNPHYRDRVRELFPPFGQGVFFHLARFLLPLQQPLQNTLDSFRQLYLRDRHVIGLHLRLQKVMPDDQGKKTLRAPQPETFFEVARMVQIGRGFPDHNTVFYVATETAAAVAAAKEWFPARNLTVVFLDDLLPMKRKDHRDAERGTVQALHNAIVEMKLLSMVDEMVGTFASSYSYCASSWGNVVPYYVMPDRTYWYAGLSEPCFRHAARGHAEKIKGSPELVYHSICAVTGNKADVVVAQRGKDGRLKDPSHKS